MTMGMRSFLSFLAFATTAAAIQELDEASFDQLMGSGKNGMIKFFQPWCGHCTRMKPDWDKLAEEAHSSVFIADVNCSDQAELCEKNDVAGYPTIKVYKDGVDEKYNGARGFDDLMDYVDANLASKCDVSKLEETCGEKAVKYANKWKDREAADVTKEFSRLEGMAGKSMTMELKAWLRERMAILKQLTASASS